MAFFAGKLKPIVNLVEHFEHRSPGVGLLAKLQNQSFINRISNRDGSRCKFVPNDSITGGVPLGTRLSERDWA